MRTLTRRDAITRATALVATLPTLGALMLPERVMAAPAPEVPPAPLGYLDHNIAYFTDRVKALADPDIIEIDRSFLMGREDNPAAFMEWEAWTAAYHALETAVLDVAPHLRPLLDAVGDRGGDLGAASERDGRERGIALACALLPVRTDPLDISALEAFQLFPLPGSVPDADATYAEVVAWLELSAALDADA